MTQNNEDFESNYYQNIIDFFQNQQFDRVSTMIWKSKIYIKLMKVLERTQNKEFVRDAILVILSLFEDNPPDIYDNQGVSSNDLPPEEKKSFKMILKSEFINEFPN
jgi:hypothetical protein